MFNCDPKTYVPYRLLNWFSGQFISNFLPKLLGAAKFTKDSPYLKRIDEKKDFYDRIKDKILRKQNVASQNESDKNLSSDSKENEK
ncbi:hypothetical protein RFI_08797 [Reticulomyxa filosa]|uniref:Uncharacterized protein n=1 Tax=Reticulomyxa filosa TaxID=46433 RepID=X6NQQ2_RETFI|nr:hypothetical protein RFI_08797 [Reticulomyxa filosa]|eukprot:ETO28336.1 hypothetical protein RFI_08797 [Reticulomyxa filosa]